MSVTVTFHCGGCDAVAVGTDSLRREFRSFSGQSHGFGSVVPSNTVEDVTPPGWCAYDPWTYATYCPDCWEWLRAVCEPGCSSHGAVDPTAACDCPRSQMPGAPERRESSV